MLLCRGEELRLLLKNGGETMKSYEVAWFIFKLAILILVPAWFIYMFLQAPGFLMPR